ncbi:MAG: hypothetical protein SOI44_00395 [Lactimicrobium sp.]|jgi:hypothetical protein|uniref:hypothetical protein n=1 Tax=Lactimicrobium sp. TaxID=2563780 RepID=UPI002F35126C
MNDFLTKEQCNMRHYANEVHAVMHHRWDMTEINGLYYHIQIKPDTVWIQDPDNCSNDQIMPTAEFARILDGFLAKGAF